MTESTEVQGPLPKLYRPVKIKFWSLRNRLGSNMGVMFDCDEEVERTVMRVRCKDGWKWQIKDISIMYEYDHYIEQDQETLDNFGMDLEFTYAKA